MTQNLLSQEEIINKTVTFVKNKLSGEASGHDWWHIFRVWNNAKLILKTEKNADRFTVELASLLHDISDWKFNNGDTTVGPKIAKEFLKSIDVEEKTISQVCEIISTISFKGANVKTPMKTLEGEIVQDADRLDAIGAVGIARTFAYGGYSGNEMYNPEIKPAIHNCFEDYKKNKGTTLNHFYEKLLLLKDRMNTKSAKQIAQNRHSYMENFLTQFIDEWNGKA